ncbi:small S protein [Colletotrichum higginsianum]|nr:small S protein [Colletotrichum higginsianum]
MDPVSAFSLAVNVLSVVDFCKTFLEILGQIKDAGSSSATRDIVDINSSLKASTAKLTPELFAEGENEGHAFKNLVQECQTLSNELIHLAEDLSVASSSKLVSKVKVTARTMWSHGKIQEKKTRLEAIRQQLLFDIVVPMAARVSTIPNMAAMDTQTQTLLTEIKAGEDANRAMEKRLHAFQEEHAAVQAVQAERHVEIVSILNDMHGSKPRPATSTTRESTLKPKHLVLKTLLDYLYFHQEIDRFHDIKPAHKGTFEWIYSEPRLGASGATWTNFHDWLQNDSGIYWISGKAGSGKSTLMKLVSTDERTRQPLLDWGVGSRLLILSFYFWNAGTTLQKSLEGLLRSIVSQALKECPELAEKLFPNRFQRCIDDTHSPTMQELERAFACLTAPGLADASLTPIKLVLLIDGLDEFDAGSMNLTELAELFTTAARSTSFKAVLSSRPENAFEEAFISCPRLRLHFLTHDDVVTYVNEKLSHHPRMVQLTLQAPNEAQALIGELVEAAQGVFLWVRLVVRSLLEGLQNHDEIDTLTERLRELPTDLEDLFRIMLEKGKNV